MAIAGVCRGFRVGAALAAMSLLPLWVVGQGSGAEGPAVVILPFAIAGAAGADSSPAASGSAGIASAASDLAASASAAACPAGARLDLTGVPAEDQTGVVTVLAAELEAQLGKNGVKAQVGVPGAAVSAGAVVLAGCFTTMDEGSAKKRIVGAGMGGSVLAAEVQILQMREGKLLPVARFAEESKGRNFGVGSGMLINAMRAKRTSLQGDAGNLADKIAKEYGKRAKELAGPK